MTDSAHGSTARGGQSDAHDDIPTLTDCEYSPANMIDVICRRVEARLQAHLAEALPPLIETAVREYLAERAQHPAPGHQ